MIPPTCSLKRPSGCYSFPVAASCIASLRRASSWVRALFFLKGMRKDIKEFAGDAKEKLSSAFEKGKELYEEGRSTVTHAYEEGKSAITSAVEAGKTAYMREKEKRHAA